MSEETSQSEDQKILEEQNESAQTPPVLGEHAERVNSVASKINKVYAAAIVGGFILLAVIVFAGYFFWPQVSGVFGLQNDTPVSNNDVFCAKDSKVCPDGSSIDRIPPNCQFSECPTIEEVIEEEIDTSDWKTYRNEKFGFEFQHPANEQVYGAEPGPDDEDWIVVGKITPGFPPVFNIKPTAIPISAESSFNPENLDLDQVKTWKISKTATEIWKMNKVETDRTTSDIEEVRISNRTGYKFYLTGAYSDWAFQQRLYVKTVYIFIDDDKGNKFQISYPADNTTSQQIISTFRFLNQPDTFDWQTYRNEELGFEVRYPKDWMYSESENHTSFVPKVFTHIEGGYPILYINRSQNNKGLHIEDWWIDSIENYNPKEKTNMLQNTERKSLEINLNDAYSVRSTDTIIGNSFHAVYIKHNGYVYTFSSQFSNEDLFGDNEYAQILSTFKFLDQPDTSDWQTYRNEELGFEVQNPGDWVYRQSDRGVTFLEKKFAEKETAIPNLHIRVVSNNEKLDIDDWWIDSIQNDGDKEQLLQYTERTFVEVNSYPAYSVRTTDAYTSIPFHRVYITVGGSIYVMNTAFGYDLFGDNDYAKILSSFNFIN